MIERKENRMKDKFESKSVFSLTEINVFFMTKSRTERKKKEGLMKKTNMWPFLFDYKSFSHFFLFCLSFKSNDIGDINGTENFLSTACCALHPQYRRLSYAKIIITFLYETRKRIKKKWDAFHTNLSRFFVSYFISVQLFE